MAVCVCVLQAARTSFLNTALLAVAYDPVIKTLNVYPVLCFEKANRLAACPSFEKTTTLLTMTSDPVIKTLKFTGRFALKKLSDRSDLI